MKATVPTVCRICGAQITVTGARLREGLAAVATDRRLGGFGLAILVEEAADALEGFCHTCGRAVRKGAVQP